MYKRILYIIFLLLLFGLISFANETTSLEDSLILKIEILQFDEIEEILEENYGMISELKQVIEALDIKYSDTSDPRIQILISLWKSKAYGGDDKAIYYAESAYDMARIAKINELTFKSLFRLGNEYLHRNQTARALDYYHKAEEYVGDIDAINTIKLDHAIGLVQQNIGDLQVAKMLFQKNLNFFEKVENQKQYNFQYTLTLFAVANLSFLQEDYERTIEYIREGSRVTHESGVKNIYDSFQLMYGAVLYAKGEYKASIISLLTSIGDTHENQTFRSDGLKYVVANYLELNQLDSALFYLSQIEKLYEKKPQSAMRALGFSYEKVNIFARENGLDSLNLHYSNKELELSSKDDEDTAEIVGKLLSNQKEVASLEHELSSRVVIKWILLFVLIVVSVVTSMWILRKKSVSSPVIAESNSSNSRISIDNDIKFRILDELRSFEENKEFLDKNLTLSSLANQLNTNPSYLSRVINSELKMSFSKYLKELRIGYAVNRLNKDLSLIHI